MSSSYERQAWTEMISLIGGFLGVVTRLSIYSLNSYANFTIDKSMIKKLYSSKDEKKGQNKSYYEDK